MSNNHRIVLGLLTLVHKKCDPESWLAQFLHRVGQGVYRASKTTTTESNTTTTGKRYLEQDDEYCRMFLRSKIKEIQDRSGDDNNILLQKQWNRYTDMLKELLEALESDTLPVNKNNELLTAWIDELFPGKNKTLYLYADADRIPFSFFIMEDREAFFKEPEGSRIRHYLFFLKSMEDLLHSQAHPMNKGDSTSYILWTSLENTLLRTAGFHGVILDRGELEKTKGRLFWNP
jgi:hypothetical protein